MLAYAEYSQISQCRISAATAIICPMLHPQAVLRSSRANSFYKSGKTLLWVSTMCAQILGFSRVSATL